MPLEPFLGNREVSSGKASSASKSSKDFHLIYHHRSQLDSAKEQSGVSGIRRYREDMDSESILPAQFRLVRLG